MTTTRTFGSKLAIAGLCMAGLAVASSAHAIPTTLIYVNSGNGSIYSYDAGNGYAETFVAAGTGAFSISSGPAANTLYLQLNSSQLATYNLVTNTQTFVGGTVIGNAFAEGRDGWLYSGGGTALYRVNPSDGSTMLLGGGPYAYAGDLAVDPTDLLSMYGAVNYINGVALVKVNKSTGFQTVIGSFGLGSAADIFGLGFSLDGTLYATGPTSNGGAIYTIDKTSGFATNVRSLTYNPYDMATQPFEVIESEVPVSRVPEPAPLALTAVGLLALAWRKRARR